MSPPPDQAPEGAVSRPRATGPYPTPLRLAAGVVLAAGTLASLIAATFLLGGFPPGGLAESPALAMNTALPLILPRAAAGDLPLTPSVTNLPASLGATPGATLRAASIPDGPRLRVPFLGVRVLDPGRAADAESVELIRNLFDGLLVADAQGKLTPAGAESFEVSADRLTYTFTLNRRARWSDGRPVTAGDYAFAWRRNVDPRKQSPYAPALFPLKNAEQINRHGGSPSDLGVRVIDDYTLEATLERPTAYFPWLVATWTYFPLRDDQIHQFGKSWVLPGRMVSNGPFTLEASSRDDELLLVRNPHYGGESPQLAAIVYRDYRRGDAHSTYQEMLAAYRRDELDVLPVVPSLVEEIERDPVLRAQLHMYARSSTSFLVLNTRRAGISDPRVRQALGMSLDRQELLNGVLQRPGEPATSLHPPGMAGRDPAAWPTEDVQKAKQLLAEAGYPDGKGLPALAYAGFWGQDSIASYLENRWRDSLGVQVAVSVVQGPSAVFSHSTEWLEQFDCYQATWNSDYVDPSNWFNLLWDSANDPRQFNSGWKNERFDELVRAAQAEQDEQARGAQYRAAESLLARDYPLIPLFHPEQRYLVKPSVQNFGPGPNGVATPLSRVHLSD